MASREEDEKAGAAGAAARRELTGLDYMRQLLSGEQTPSGMARTLDFRLIEVGEGRAVFSVRPDERHYNGLGIAHGGLAATLLDSALGSAINTLMPAGRVFTTLEMKVNYVRPLTAAAGEVRCEARVVHAGRTVATAEGRLTDSAGRLYAHGTATCMLFRGRGPEAEKGG